MKLLIAGKRIQIDEYVELISESPLINNFDTQYVQYSNSFEVKYNGDITTLIDVSKLRKTTGVKSPYLLIDGFLIDGVIFVPVTIIINSFDPGKNTIKMNVTERYLFGIAGGLDIRTAKLTELRHTFDALLEIAGLTDEIILPVGTLDLAPWGISYLGEASVLADMQLYEHEITTGNSCPVVSLSKLIDFLEARHGIVISDEPAGISFFANRQMPFYGDLIKGVISEIGITASTLYLMPDVYPDSIYPAGILPSGFSAAGTKTVKYTNKIGDLGGNFVSCTITVAEGVTPDPVEFSVAFRGTGLDYISTAGQVMTFGIADKSTELSLEIKASDDAFHARAIGFSVLNFIPRVYDFAADCRFNIEIPLSTVQATDDNSRQVFQNMPDITIIDFFKTIAKASAKYLEITATGFKFVDIADSLLPGSIVDASDKLISVNSINYSLYDAPSLEYWYKDAATATLIVPISDERVKGTVKKIEIDMLRTDNENVALFEADGIKPLVGVATYPLLDITYYAADLAAFYLSIQNPYLVTATFKKIDLSLVNSVLIRQLNGLFIPKKIIKTNRDIIELELLKIDI